MLSEVVGCNYVDMSVRCMIEISIPETTIAHGKEADDTFIISDRREVLLTTTSFSSLPLTTNI
jgi:hypothetical protein